MRAAFITLGKAALACFFALWAEVFLFIAFVAFATSFGSCMPVVWFLVEIYFFPAEIFGRSFDRPFGIHWILLPVFWGLIAYGIVVLIQTVWKRAA